VQALFCDVTVAESTVLQVASTTWFMNFLSMAGVRKGHITQLLDRLPDTRNNNNTENWEGEPGGRGIRALTRYLDTYSVHTAKNQYRKSRTNIPRKQCVMT
jgi:hypothetical protein